MNDWFGILLPLWLMFLFPPKKDDMNSPYKKEVINAPKPKDQLKDSNYIGTPCEIDKNGQCIRHKHKNG